MWGRAGIEHDFLRMTSMEEYIKTYRFENEERQGMLDLKRPYRYCNLD
jgi:hypothetical protein